MDARTFLFHLMVKHWEFLHKRKLPGKVLPGDMPTIEKFHSEFCLRLTRSVLEHGSYVERADFVNMTGDAMGGGHWGGYWDDETLDAWDALVRDEFRKAKVTSGTVH